MQNDANNTNDVNEFIGVSLTIQAGIKIFHHFKTNILNLDILKHKIYFYSNLLEKKKKNMPYTPK